jgi:hypothetical protein
MVASRIAGFENRAVPALLELVAMSSSLHPVPSPEHPKDRRGRHPTCRRVLLAGFLLLFGLAAPDSVASQTPKREPVVVELLPGARALALGMAPQVGSNDPDLAWAHPALVQDLQGVQGSYTRFGSAAAAYTLSAATDWLGGGVAVTLHSLEYGRPSGTSPGERTIGLDDLFGEAGIEEAVGEMAASATYGRTVGGFQVGVTGRIFTQRYGAERVSGQSVDLGLARQVGPVQVALSGRNLGNYERLPQEVVLGAGAYGQPLGPLDLGAAAQVRYRDDGELELGGGVEFGYWPVRGRTFVGRVGVRSVREGEASPVTFGGSFWGDSLVLDYAFQPMDGLDGIHRLSIGFR